MEFVSIEARPRLCSCNVYMCIQKDKSFNNVEIRLSEESIILSINGTSTTLVLPNIRIVPKSLSALNINKNWIWFHLQSKPPIFSFGSVKAELVINNESQKNAKIPSHVNAPLLKNVEYKIICGCCKNIVSKATSFERIFPFPDIDYDLSEWFCCKSHITNSNFLNLLHPQEQDYYYGQFFSIFNKNIFKSNVRVDKGLLLCNKCLYGLGKLHLEHSFKIWNCSVEFQSSNTPAMRISSDPLFDFIRIIKGSESASLGEEIILESFVSREIHYLVIKPMAWELCLITEPEEISNSSEVHLQQKQVIKALYKYTNSLCTARNNGINMTYYEVGLPIIEAGLKYLLSSTKRIPQPYRSTGDYYIGHIDSDILTK